ncbi:uncharacterized protein [Asterias amurensis]|uniref:uncharacterized protein n=1 Tax=Asterias amurensis TaxID=7602 RepID=UPI003AB1F15C
MNSQTKLFAICVCILSVAVLNQFCSAAAVPPKTVVPGSNVTTDDVTTVSSETTVTSEETATQEEVTGTGLSKEPAAVSFNTTTEPESSVISETPKPEVPNPQPGEPPVAPAKPDSHTQSPTRTEAKKAPEGPDGETDKIREETTSSELTTAPTKPPSPTQLPTTPVRTTNLLATTSPSTTTTELTTTAPQITTTHSPITTVATMKATSQQPTTPIPKKEVTTKHPAVTLPPPVELTTQAPPATTTLAQTTQKPQPVKTKEPHQGDDEESGDHHTHSPLTSNPETNKNDTDNSWLDKFSNNSLISKLMFPVILGVVAAFVIVCFAYGVRTCRKNKSRGRRKLMSNGQDHDMSGNFDRVQLLADSSEDEF